MKIIVRRELRTSRSHRTWEASLPVGATIRSVDWMHGQCGVYLVVTAEGDKDAPEETRWFVLVRNGEEVPANSRYISSPRYTNSSGVQFYSAYLIE